MLFINPKNKDGSLNYKIFINPTHIIKFYETRYGEVYGTNIELDAGEKLIYSYESPEDFNNRLNDIINEERNEKINEENNEEEEYYSYEDLPDSEEIHRPSDCDDYDDIYEYARSYLEQNYKYAVKSFVIEFDLQRIYITHIVWEE